jgi:endonuclease YncB( thermonuclease family)
MSKLRNAFRAIGELLPDPMPWWTCLLPMILWFALLCAVLAGAAQAAEPQQVKVIEIHDADTFWVQPQASQPFKTRLWGADAPELASKGRWGDQPFGRWAALRAAQVLQGRTVTIIRKGKSYDRVVAQVILPDGADYAAWLIGQGYARWDQRYAPRAANLRQAEERARAEGWAIHRACDQAPPWEWRRHVHR